MAEGGVGRGGLPLYPDANGQAADGFPSSSRTALQQPNFVIPLSLVTISALLTNDLQNLNLIYPGNGDELVQHARSPDQHTNVASFPQFYTQSLSVSPLLKNGVMWLMNGSNSTPAPLRIRLELQLQLQRVLSLKALLNS